MSTPTTKEWLSGILRTLAATPPRPKRGRPPLSSEEKRRRAALREADKAELRHLRELAKQAARDKRTARQERRVARKIATAIYRMEYSDANPPAPRIRRCLNPDCLVWFTHAAGRGGDLNACSPACASEINRLVKMDPNNMSRSLLRAHARMVSKRNTMIHDRPVPTPYALRLIANIENQKANHEAGITRLEGTESLPPAR